MTTGWRNYLVALFDGSQWNFLIVGCGGQRVFVVHQEEGEETDLAEENSMRRQ